MSATSALPMFLQFMNPNNSGAPAASFQLFTYAAGTSTKQATWTDSSQSVQNANPLVLDANGRAVVWGDPNSLYKFVIAPSNSSDPPSSSTWSQDNVAFPLTIDVVTQGFIGGLLYPQTAAEATAGVTPTNYAYAPGDVRRYGFDGDAGTTDNTTALNNALKANAGALPVYVPNMGGYAKVSGLLTAPADTEIILEDGAELRWTTAGETAAQWLDADATAGIEVTGDNFVLKGRGKLTGPTAAGSYTANEFGIMRVGPGSGNQSTSAPGECFLVEDAELSNWGSSAVGLQFVDQATVQRCHIHDCGRSGVLFLSCKFPLADANVVHDITPGDSSSLAYGIAFTHDSTGYDADTEVLSGNQRQAKQPFCTAFVARHNTIYNVPSWEGLDSHGGFDGVFDGNKIYNCYVGINLAESSGDAEGYSGENNKVINNTLIAYCIDGSATTVANGGAAGTGSQVGCYLNGASAPSSLQQYHRNVTFSGNTLVGWGWKTGGGTTAYSLSLQSVTGGNITGNNFEAAYGDTIAAPKFDGVISNNTFGATGQTANSRAIYIQGTNGHVVVSGNRHNVTDGGNAYAIGIDMASTNAIRIIALGNDFSAAATPYYETHMQVLTAGISDLIPWIQLTGSAGGSQTVDLSPAGTAPVVYVESLQTADYTLTDFLNGILGQKVIFVQREAVTATINDSGTIKLQGGTAAATKYSTLEFVCVATGTTPTHLEVCRALGNS